MPRVKRRTEDVGKAARGAGTFADLLVPEWLQEKLRAEGYEHPSPVQEAFLPAASKGDNILAGAKSGTGKTIAFVAHAARVADAGATAIVLSPTREVALQTAAIADRVLGGRRACVGVVGGRSEKSDKESLANAQAGVVSGTPGRLVSLARSGSLPTGEVRLLVVDEADKVALDFRDEAAFLVESTPEAKQVVAFSATAYQEATLKLWKELHLSQPRYVDVDEGELSLKGLKHAYALIGSTGSDSEPAAMVERRRAEAAGRVLHRAEFHQALVFCSGKATGERLTETLKEQGHVAAFTSGSLDQPQREATLKAVRELRVRCLVATDLASRGIDLPRVNLVVNAHLTEDPATYLHRAGRCGRFGVTGLVVSIVAGSEELERLRGTLSALGVSEEPFKVDLEQGEPSPLVADWGESVELEGREKQDLRRLQAHPFAAQVDARAAILAGDGDHGREWEHRRQWASWWWWWWHDKCFGTSYVVDWQSSGEPPTCSHSPWPPWIQPPPPL